ncbi:unnamed protein product, partial [Iphiclides podalirius]
MGAPMASGWVARRGAVRATPAPVGRRITTTSCCRAAAQPPSRAHTEPTRPPHGVRALPPVAPESGGERMSRGDLCTGKRLWHHEQTREAYRVRL